MDHDLLPPSGLPHNIIRLVPYNKHLLFLSPPSITINKYSSQWVTVARNLRAINIVTVAAAITATVATIRAEVLANAKGIKMDTVMLEIPT